MVDPTYRSSAKTTRILRIHGLTPINNVCQRHDKPGYCAVPATGIMLKLAERSTPSKQASRGRAEHRKSPSIRPVPCGRSAIALIEQMLVYACVAFMPHPAHKTVSDGEPDGVVGGRVATPVG